jgi:Zn-dependent M28 family amino/carboxypeptidase
MGSAGPARDFGTSGDGHVSLQDDLIAVLRARGRSFTPDDRPEAGLFFRSDHFPMAKRGVPAISVRSGQDLLEGGTEAGRAVIDAFVRDRYHQPADEWSDDWDLTGLAHDIGVVHALGRDLATSTRWPEWKAGSEFKPIRDASAAARR